MPIRLMVAEEQAEEAARILETKGPELSEDFDPGPMAGQAQGTSVKSDLGAHRIPGVVPHVHAWW